MLKRGFEIVFGILLVLLGLLLMIPGVPGPGIAVIIVGVTFISPWHGRRLIYWFSQAWKIIKEKWHAFRFNRKSKKLRQIWPFNSDPK